jgi:serine/threonine-protein kinase
MGKAVMSRLDDHNQQEPPDQAGETILAEFIDTALDRLARGETVEVAQMLQETPELIGRGQRLLDDVAHLLDAAGALREHERWLESDISVLSTAEVRAPTADEPPPDPFPGDFRASRRLGAGAFGTVWLAEDLHLGRLVALKRVRTSSPAGPIARLLPRLREEARLLAAVRHRNVVQVYAWREAADSSYLVLQYVPGGSLADRVEREGPLHWRLAARYIADVAEGLLAVHGQGIIHRDVKPANILWDPQTDEAVLTDFGISARLAAAGSVGGTPLYMPPEAFAGEVSPAQDVYGLAASLFWLVTGSVPFPALTREEIITRARQGLPDPDRRCAGLPRPLEQLIRAGLAADWTRRPALPEFAAGLRGVLNQLLADSLVLGAPPAKQAPARLRLTVSRQADRHTFVPLATTQPPPDHVLRDMRRVPRQPERVDAHTGERLRIEVETDRPGYMTVFNVGPSGNLNLLYPAEPVPAAAPPVVPAGRPLHILDVELTPPAGRERLFALWTRVPLLLRLDEMLKLAEQGTLPVSGPYRATRDMVRVQESVQQLRPEDWHVTILELQHLPSLENA